MKKVIMLIMAVALIALPTMAQQETWRSTSTMQGTGSAYAPQLAPIGAATVADMGTTTTTPTGPTGPRRAFDTGGETGKSTESPVGDAVIPLLVMSLAFCGYIAVRRRRAASNG